MGHDLTPDACLEARDVGNERVPVHGSGHSGSDPALALSLMALQRSAGNRAVVSLLAQGQADSDVIQRVKTRGAKAKKVERYEPEADSDAEFESDLGEESESDSDHSDEEDWDPADELPEPYEPLELLGIDPLYRRPAWSNNVKAWVINEFKNVVTCPCGAQLTPKKVPFPGKRARSKNLMRVNYDIDHRTIKWADRVAAMQALQTGGTLIDKPLVRRVHESKLRLMHSSCNVSHTYEPKSGPSGFKLTDYMGNPAG